MGLLDELKKLTKPYDEEEFLEDELAEPARAPARGRDPRGYAAYAEPPRQQEAAPQRRSPYAVFGHQGQAAPQQPQQQAYAGYPPQGGYGAQNAYAPQGGYGQGGYPQGGYGAQAPYGQGGNVVNFTPQAQPKMLLVKPERFELAADIADRLQERNAIVLNLEATPKDTARRLLDFLSGAAYALNGKIKKVAGNTYVITPAGMDFMGDGLEELQSKGSYF